MEKEKTEIWFLQHKWSDFLYYFLYRRIVFKQNKLLKR